MTEVLVNVLGNTNTWGCNFGTAPPREEKKIEVFSSSSLFAQGEAKQQVWEAEQQVWKSILHDLSMPCKYRPTYIRP
jgi:hypothetical protein